MRARIVFSHGNSFPGGTYRLMLDNLRQRGFEVQAIDRFGTTRNTRSPTTGRTCSSSWPTRLAPGSKKRWRLAKLASPPFWWAIRSAAS